TPKNLANDFFFGECLSKHLQRVDDTVELFQSDFNSFSIFHLEKLVFSSQGANFGFLDMIGSFEGHN
ncbi:hypothetical protein PIB30_114045, partial [Stylosanthes scabra]|nr:hypothetical protein [Stylosanthes scabra]